MDKSCSSPLPISDYLAGISIGNGTKNAAIYCAIGSTDPFRGEWTDLMAQLIGRVSYLNPQQMKERLTKLEGKTEGNGEENGYLHVRNPQFIHLCAEPLVVEVVLPHFHTTELVFARHLIATFISKRPAVLTGHQ